MELATMKEKSIPELMEALNNLQKERFKLKVKQSSGELSTFHEFGKIRKSMARILTIVAEKKRANQ